ncbi:MAG: type VI secretion system membrane subunit TssM [Thermodesulfobacteriota bacterium]
MKTFLIFLQGFLLGRTGSTAMGVTLLLSLIWWGGPYIGLESERARLFTMLGLLLLVGAIFLGRWLWVRRRSDQFHDALQNSGEAGPDRQVEISELKEKMDSTIAALKTSGLGLGHRGNAALYALPWYLIIGPSAAGKTTLLRNSGLHFPYDIGENSDIKGFGGTRNCDWWFSDEAVLLDTAGRYTTEEDDKQEWTAFLGLLRKYRPKMPVNGVIVAVSLAELLTADKEGIKWHVKVIRDRLNELVSNLGGIFPVYLVVTKTDLLHGFSSYFEEMSAEDRQQVWGAWLVDEESEQDISDLFAQRLTSLYERLNQQRLHKMTLQRKLSFKNQIFDFPYQFKEACENLQTFFDLLIKENPYQETPRFCGVYFTSGAQEGTPIQRIVGNLRHAFGFVDRLAEDDPHATPAGSGFFIKKLFKDVIFPNSQAVTKNRRSVLIQRWMKTAWIMAAVALIIGNFLLLSTSFTSNTLLVRGGTSAAQGLEKQIKVKSQTIAGIYPALADSFSHYQKLLRYEEKLPWHLVFGIYQGDEQIQPLEEIMLNSMKLAFFDTTLRHMEYRLGDFARQWDTFDEQGRAKLRDRYYTELQAYLMVSEPDHLDLDTAAPVLATTWKGLIMRAESETTFSEEESGQLEEMVRFYLAHILRAEKGEETLHVAAWQLREDLVSRAQENLRTPPNAERLYAQLKVKAKVSLKAKGLDDLIMGSGRGLMTSSYQLPGAYTAKGWREFVHPEIKDVVAAASRGDWVLGSYSPPQSSAALAPADTAEGAEPEQEKANINVDTQLAAQLESDIRQQFFNDYAMAWFQLIASIRYEPATSLEDGIKKTLKVARREGPIGELMRTLEKNINLHEPIGEGDSLAERLPVEELDSIFADLRKFANPADKMNTSLLLNQYLLSLSAIQGELERLKAAVNVSREASSFAANILAGSGGEKELYKGWVTTTSMLNGIEPRTRQVAENLFVSPIRNAWASVLQEASVDLQQQWRNKVVTQYRQTLSGKYPFDRNGDDASPGEVSDFFNPQEGIYWAFVDEYLKPFLTKGRGGKWQVKTWLEEGPRFSKQALNGLRRSQVISSGLFRKGRDEPQFTFFVYPIPAKGLTESLLSMNGQEYRYRNGPQEWVKFNWPGKGEASSAQIRGVIGLEATSSAERSYRGPWALFRLLDSSKMARKSSREQLCAWKMKGSNSSTIEVKFKLKADRAGNVFAKNALSGYALPTSLF